MISSLSTLGKLIKRSWMLLFCIKENTDVEIGVKFVICCWLR